jgi:hypothetical protein
MIVDRCRRWFMSRWKPWGVGVVVLLLSGCATDPAPTRASDDPQRRQLAEAGQRIAQALETLAVIEQAAHPIAAQAIASPAHAPEALRVRVAVDYQGDIKPFVHRLAEVVGYTVRTYGRSSVLIPVNVQTADRTIGELLADAGWQASWRCQLVVRPEQRVVDLYYDPRRPARRTARTSRRG